MAYRTVTAKNFDELLTQDSKTVLLDFWAPWCGPCKQIAPIIEEIAIAREDLVVGKVNVDDEAELAQRFRILSIPTLVVIRDGAVTARAVGFRNKDEILAMIEK